MLRKAPKQFGVLKRSTKIAFAIIAVVSALELLAFSGTYLLYSSKYVTTDNAQVDGDKIDINAPRTGNVTDWSLAEGSSVRTNQVVGHIQDVGSGARAKQTVRSSGTGTIASNDVVAGQYVQAGTRLATAYNMNNIYLTARVPETEIGEVGLGMSVDISVDAFPGTAVTGQVLEIQSAAASNFTVYPSSDTDPSNPQKVDQYIPVKIAIIDSAGAALSPGMNATVHIHKS
jgi:multidrug resistance efflux pump